MSAKNKPSSSAGRPASGSRGARKTPANSSAKADADSGPGLREAMAILEPSLPKLASKLGLELLECRLATSSGRPVVRLVIDKPYGGCAKDATSEDALSEDALADAGQSSAGESSEDQSGTSACEIRSGVTVDDCAAMSRLVSRLLDKIYPDEGPEYSLEVSSPGLDRALVTEADFRRFNGALAKVRLMVEGRLTRRVGRLATKGDPWRLITRDEEIAFDRSMVKGAKLVPEI